MSGEQIEPQLEVAIMNALRGADKLRDKLLLALTGGTPSVSDLAYAIKVRVKEDYKIAEKIFDRRRKKPAYDVDNVTDIVGVRVVTLYRLDALQIRRGAERQKPRRLADDRRASAMTNSSLCRTSQLALRALRMVA